MSLFHNWNRLKDFCGACPDGQPRFCLFSSEVYAKTVASYGKNQVVAAEVPRYMAKLWPATEKIKLWQRKFRGIWQNCGWLRNFRLLNLKKTEVRRHLRQLPRNLLKIHIQSVSLLKVLLRILEETPYHNDHNNPYRKCCYDRHCLQIIH